MALFFTRRTFGPALAGLAAAVCLLGPLRCLAQPEHELYLAEAKSALGGRYKSSSIVPIEVVVTNKGAPAIVELVVQPKSADTGAVVRKTVTIGKGSFRHFLYLNVDVSVTTFRVTMYSERGRPLDTMELEAPCVPEERLLIGFSGATKPLVGGGGGDDGAAAVVPITAESMPDHWIGLSGVDALVVNDVDANMITLAAQRAVRSWLARGGTLVLIGGERYPYLEHPFFREFLPVGVAGSRQVTALEGLRGLTGAPWRGSVPLVLCEAVRAGGQVLAEEPAGGGGRSYLPLVAEQSYGMGTVLFVAFDPGAPGLRGWENLPVLWHRLLGVPKPREKGSQKVYSCNVGRALTSCLRLKEGSLSFFWVALFIVVYIVIAGPVDYVVLRRLGRLAWTWVTFPSYIVVFSCLGYFLAYSAKGGDMLIHKLSVMDVDSASRKGYGTTYFSFFSPKNSAYRFPLEEGTFANEVVSASAPGGQQMFLVSEAVALIQNPPQWVLQAKVNIWSMKYFRTSWEAGNQPGLSGRITASPGDGLSGSLRNTTPHRLTRTAVLFGDRIYYPPAYGTAPGGEIALNSKVKAKALSEILMGKVFKQYNQYGYYETASAEDAFTTIVAMTGAPALRQLKVDPKSPSDNEWIWKEFAKRYAVVEIHQGEATSITNLGRYLLEGKAILVAQTETPLHDVVVEGWTHKDMDSSFIRQIFDVGRADE